MTGRTYRYATAEPLFPFGFGLSYARFAYDNLRVSPATLAASVPVPRQKLVAFRRLRLRPGQSKKVAFTITPEMLSLVDDEGRARQEPGEFRLTIGGCSPGARGLALGASSPVSALFAVQEASAGS